MGSWGPGLYQDDTAADIRSTIALLAALPVSGDRLLDILVEGHGEGVDLADDGGPTFWLVVADQFERRGIASPKAFERALAAIETGADLHDLERRDASPSDLKKRAKVLTAMANRLRRPRPHRPRPQGTRPPPFVVEVGEVYRFPTMLANQAEAFNPWFPTWEAAGFKPDAWGALLVVARGRVFDWFPWCATASLTVTPSRPPTLDDAVRARFISPTQGATLCLPRRTHLTRMQMELVGRLSLDPDKAAAAVSREHSPRHAVICGWSFVPQARSWEGRSEGGAAVSQLIAALSGAS